MNAFERKPRNTKIEIGNWKKKIDSKTFSKLRELRVETLHHGNSCAHICEVKRLVLNRYKNLLDTNTTGVKSEDRVSSSIPIGHVPEPSLMELYSSYRIRVE